MYSPNCFYLYPFIGYQDWLKTRLAVVKSSKPYYLKKSNKLTSTENLEALVTDVSLWDSFSDKFSQFTNRKMKDVIAIQRDRLAHGNWYYPQLGIQRPVSDVNKAKSYQPKAIKIT